MSPTKHKITEEQARDIAKSAESAAKLRAMVAKAPRAVAPEPKPAPERVGEQMSFFPEAVAAMPQEFGRTALFGMPSRGGPRKMLNEVTLAGRQDFKVIYSGIELGTHEETLWLACLRLGRGRPMGERIYLNMSGLLKELGIKDSGGPDGSRVAVAKRLDRLASAFLKIEKDGVGIRTHLLNWGLEEATGQMFIRLDPDGAPLFKFLAYQPWQVRLSLKSDVAARLLSYVCGHATGKPHSALLSHLQSWCGYPGPRTWDWRKRCLAGLAELEQKHVIERGSVKLTDGANGQVVSWKRTSADFIPDDVPTVLE